MLELERSLKHAIFEQSIDLSQLDVHRVVVEQMASAQDDLGRIERLADEVVGTCFKGSHPCLDTCFVEHGNNRSMFDGKNTSKTLDDLSAIVLRHMDEHEIRRKLMNVFAYIVRQLFECRVTGGTATTSDETTEVVFIDAATPPDAAR